MELTHPHTAPQPGTNKKHFDKLHQLKLATGNHVLRARRVRDGVQLGSCQRLSTLHAIQDVAHGHQTQVREGDHEHRAEHDADTVEGPRDAQEATAWAASNHVTNDDEGMYKNAHGSVPMMKFNVMHTATGREMRSFRISGSSSSWYLDTFLSFGVSKNGTDCCSKLVRRACTEPSTLRLGKDMATERCTRHRLRRDAGCCPFREKPPWQY